MYCRVCGKEMEGKDSKLYCSTACKQKALRTKQKNLQLQNDYNDISTAIVPYQHQTAIVPYQHQTAIMPPSLHNRSMSLSVAPKAMMGDSLARGLMGGVESHILGSVTGTLRNVTDIKTHPFYAWGSILVAGIGFFVGGNIDKKKNKFNWRNSAIGVGIGFFSFQIGSNLVLQYKYYRNGLQLQQAEIKQLQQNNSNSSLNDKIISSQDARYINVPSIKLTGVYGNFIGDTINENFVVLVYGNAGSGKSHFASKFASYLENRGKVLYVLAEESLTNSVQERLDKYDLNKVDLAITRNPQLILSKAENYNYIIIDSMNGLVNYNYHSEFVKKLKSKGLYGVILVNQVNKEGNFVGTNEILHEVDVEVYIEKGVAITKKNRFNTQETKMNIFSNDNSNVVKLHNQYKLAAEG